MSACAKIPPTIVQGEATVWRVLGPGWDSHVAYPKPVGADVVLKDYSEAQHVEPVNPLKMKASTSSKVTVSEPRPCPGCRHWIPDEINPRGGLGGCAIELRRGPAWPAIPVLCEKREEGGGET